MVTDEQVRLLMAETRKGVPLVTAAAKSGMTAPTARKWQGSARNPSEVRPQRVWRTRQDPFQEHWPEIEQFLEMDPSIGAKTVFEWLVEEYPGQYQGGQLRTLQRRFQQWRRERGPERQLFFEQEREPGVQCQSDFTHMGSLGVTIGGREYPHLLYHFVLPYSLWEHVEVVASESFEALAEGLQESLWALGGVPREHRTDNLSAATHQLRKSGGREYNERYLEYLGYYGLEASRNYPGNAHENGTVEAMHGHFKRAVEQRLQLSGTRDFRTEGSYERMLWQIEAGRNAGRGERLEGSYERMLWQIEAGRNAGRGERLEVERGALRALPAQKLPAYREQRRTVGVGGTVRMGNKAYSVPSRLAGARVEVRQWARRVEIFHRGKLEAEHERARGKQPGRVNYRHVVGGLVRKPGAFAQYRFREEMFPTEVFREAHDRLRARRKGLPADLECLRLLQLAAQGTQSEVERALAKLMASGKCPDLESVRALLPEGRVECPEVRIGEPDLEQYDALLGAAGEAG